MSPVLVSYHPDVEVIPPAAESSALGLDPVYRGHEGVRRFFRPWKAGFGSHRYELHEIADAGWRDADPGGRAHDLARELPHLGRGTRSAPPSGGRALALGGLEEGLVALHGALGAGLLLGVVVAALDLLLGFLEARLEGAPVDLVRRDRLLDEY